MTIQSNSSSPSAIDIAGRTHRNIFFAYLVWILIAAVVTALFTWALWRASNRKNDAVIAETNERAAKLEKEAADARTRQAEAEKLLAQVKKKQDPRVIRADMFKNARFSSEPYRVDVLYPKASDESFIVAGQLARALSEIPGWSISAPKPVPESTEQELSPLLAAGGQPLGITIRTSNLDGVAKALMRTLNQDDFETVRVRDPSLAANELKIIVGPRL